MTTGTIGDAQPPPGVSESGMTAIGDTDDENLNSIWSPRGDERLGRLARVAGGGPGGSPGPAVITAGHIRVSHGLGSDGCHQLAIC